MAVFSEDSSTFTPFFDRYISSASTKDDCVAFIKSRYSEPIRLAPFQGYCSFTVFVGEDTVVQLRPSAYGLDMAMTRTACNIFGNLAPETEYLGQVKGTDLHAFSMRKVPGVSLADYRAMSRKRSAREQIVLDFAHLQARAWRHAKCADDLYKSKRTVGSSLRVRLEMMSSSLPVRLRRIASNILGEISDIETLPWVCTHGDFLATNIMVDYQSGKLTGLLDWAEAEWLPFGIGIYGLEELLGENNDPGRFGYYPEAGHLRDIFWKALMLSIPKLAQDPQEVVRVEKAQHLGVLLWHGIAFDDGKLNRVVEEGRDDHEIHKLNLFFAQSLNTE
ncbi:hypothetical protein GGS21DRAFT_190776 [Xylaria nigripes]|nr:hypothetical protein GGS21DRAFT_190776 [Xylaria nigripes]